MVYYGLLTNPSNNIMDEIIKIYDLGFDYVEIAIEGPGGNPELIDKRKNDILNLTRKFKREAIGHTPYWIDLGSDYGYIRDAWILEAIREIRTAKGIGLGLVNIHANLNGMHFGEKRKILLDNLIRSLREIIKYADKSDVKIMLENVPLSNGIHKLSEIKYIVDNVSNLYVHLDIPHAFTSGGMESVTEYIKTFKEKIIHIHWHDNHGNSDEHLPIGKGLIDHEQIVGILKDIQYNRTITLEVFTSSNDAIASADKLRTYWHD